MKQQANTFHCIICESENEPTLVQETVKGDQKNILRAVRCITCNHIQLNPPNYSIDHYMEDGQVNYVVHDYGTPIEKIVEHSWIEAVRRVKRFSQQNISLSCPGKPFRILDIGGGYGFFASELMRQFPEIEVDVMEPSAKRAELGRNYLISQGVGVNPLPNFIVEPLGVEFSQKYYGSYDMVTMWHVLEHVSTPVTFLKWAFDLVSSDGGILCIEVPNVRDELMLLSSAFRDRNYMIEHISYFSSHILENVAKKVAPNLKVSIRGYQRYGIFNYFHWIHFNEPQGGNPDLFEGKDRWWLEASWRAAREEAMTSDALFMSLHR